MHVPLLLLLWLHDLYSPNSIKVIETKGITCAGHVVLMGEKRNSYRILVKKTGKGHLEDLGIDGYNIKINLP